MNIQYDNRFETYIGNPRLESLDLKQFKRLILIDKPYIGTPRLEAIYTSPIEP